MKNILLILFFLISTVLAQAPVSQEINKNTYSNPQLIDYVKNSMSMLWIREKDGTYPEPVCTVFSLEHNGIQEWVSASHCVLDDSKENVEKNIGDLYIGLYSDHLTKVNIKYAVWNEPLSYDYLRLEQEDTTYLPELSFVKCKANPTPGEMVWGIGSPYMVMPLVIPGYYAGELVTTNSPLLKLLHGRQTYNYHLITQRLYKGASGAPIIRLENNKYCVFGIMSFYYNEEVFPFFLGSVASRMF